MDRAVVLLSGGIDSVTLLHVVKGEIDVPHVIALSFDYGQKHSRELEAAKFQAEDAGAAEHRIVDISGLGGLFAGSALTDAAVTVPDLSAIDEHRRAQPPTYVPNRNMILLSLAAAYAESRDIHDVFYGAQAQDEYGYWDCAEDFLERINSLLALNRRGPVTVHAPFIALKKSAIVRKGQELGVDYSRTWSCYRGGELPCGACPTCVERAAAFRDAGATDPLSFGRPCGRTRGTC